MWDERRDVFYTDDFMYFELGIEQLPSKLHRYTSFASLEKTLCSTKLRFSRLDQMNDPEEAIAVDLHLASSSIFASCWTNADSESIPMWSMYGDNFNGVRITLPSNMFAGRHEPTIYEEGGALTIVDGSWSIRRPPPAMSTVTSAIIGPNKVFYSDDMKYRKRKMLYREGGRVNYVPYDLGMVKTLQWSYEQEWRFKIAALSFESNFPNDAYFNGVTANLADFPVIDEHLLVPLDRDAISQIEVISGPKMNKKDIANLEKLLADHAPKAKLTESQIRIR